MISSPPQLPLAPSAITTRKVMPGAPAAPAVPAGPGGPARPGAPVSPLTPAAPCGPVAPVGPGGPCSPFAPRRLAPATPCGPGGPAGPVCALGAGSFHPFAIPRIQRVPRVPPDRYRLWRRLHPSLPHHPSGPQRRRILVNLAAPIVPTQPRARRHAQRWARPVTSEFHCLPPFCQGLCRYADLGLPLPIGAPHCGAPRRELT